MVFSSHLFFYLYLPLALVLYHASPRPAKHLVLTALSYLFYGWANPAFVLLLATSTSIDYCAGRVIAWYPTERGGPRRRAQRVALVVSIFANLGFLGFFKYFDFAVSSVNALALWLGAEAEPIRAALEVVLPLGISFYTFQSMSYTIDVYRGDADALQNPIDFACYVSMFPQLVAGPIIRFSDVSRQLVERQHTLDKAARGASLVALGMGKKVLLANPCGQIADTVFGAQSVGFLEAWWGLVAYAFQILFDFSGYSDMAIGLGLMLGFVFPKNFDSPYRSASITEFWQRWHISLSSWLRDYLYIPLGGNRKGPRRTYLHLAVVMLLGGLWHGAAWTFVLWGAWHGLLLALERGTGWARHDARGLARVGRTALTFVLVLLGWTLFRADSLSHAVAYLGALAGQSSGPEAALLAGLVYTPYHTSRLLLAGLIAFAAPPSWSWTQRLTPGRAALAVAVLWAALLELNAQAYNPFIYFIF